MMVAVPRPIDTMKVEIGPQHFGSHRLACVQNYDTATEPLPQDLLQGVEVYPNQMYAAVATAVARIPLELGGLALMVQG